tara:strand:- start:39774 stop:40169 length:396 start_codon:yes stop_codon:yes gene_type:complete
MDRDSTNSQNAVGESLAYALRPPRIDGKLPSPLPLPLEEFSRDFNSASFCALNTRILHAIKDKHTAVVNEPPMLVMCMVTRGAAHWGERDPPLTRRACPSGRSMIYKKRKLGTKDLESSDFESLESLSSAS